MARPINLKLHERRKSQVLEAAKSLIAEQGLQHTSMQAICQAAKLSPGALYRYFPSKDAILQAITRQEAAAIDELVDYIDASDGLLDALVVGSQEIVDELTDERDARLGIELQVLAYQDNTWADLFLASDAKLKEALVGAIRRDQMSGKIDKRIDPDAAAYLIISLWDGMMDRGAFSRPPDRKALARQMGAMLKGLLGQLKG